MNSLRYKSELIVRDSIAFFFYAFLISLASFYVQDIFLLFLNIKFELYTSFIISAFGLFCFSMLFPYEKIIKSSFLGKYIYKKEKLKSFIFPDKHINSYIFSDNFIVCVCEDKLHHETDPAIYSKENLELTMDNQNINIKKNDYSCYFLMGKQFHNEKLFLNGIESLKKQINMSNKLTNFI